MHRPGHKAQLPIMRHIVSKKHWHAHDIKRSINCSDLQSTEGRLTIKCLKIGQVVLSRHLEPATIKHEIDGRKVCLARGVSIAAIETVFHASVTVELLDEGLVPEDGQVDVRAACIKNGVQASIALKLTRIVIRVREGEKIVFANPYALVRKRPEVVVKQAHVCRFVRLFAGVWLSYVDPRDVAFGQTSRKRRLQFILKIDFFQEKVIAAALWC